MPLWWAERAWLGGADNAIGVLLEVKGERFAAVETGVDHPPAGAQRLEGLTLPGLANVHSHAFHRALRGRTHEGGGTFWTWRDVMYSAAARLDPESYHRLARAVFAEMALAGFTAVGEFHYLHHGPDGAPYLDPNEMGRALIDAARSAGIRITLLDTCYLTGGIDAPLSEVQRRYSDGDAAQWAARVDDLSEDTNTRIAAAVHSVRAVPPAAAAEVAAWAAAAGRPLHAHVSEQQQEQHDCHARYGRSPLSVLAEAGAVGPDFTAVHGTHFSKEDVDLLGTAGGACCFCPTTERDLGDGIGPARALLDTGARINVGSDSHAVIDGFEEARAIELDGRLAAKRRGLIRPADLMRAATLDGMASLAWDAGAIEPGRLADFVSIRLDTPRTAGADPASVSSAVFAASAADVHSVMVGGRQVVGDGCHLKLPEVGRELAASIEALWK